MYSYLTTYSPTGTASTVVAGSTALTSSKDFFTASRTQEYVTGEATGTTTYYGTQSENSYNFFDSATDKFFRREYDYGFSNIAVGIVDEVDAFQTGATFYRQFSSIQLISTSPYQPFSTFRLTHFDQYYISGEASADTRGIIPVYRYEISAGRMFIHHYGSTYSKVNESGGYIRLTTGDDDQFEPYYSNTSGEEIGTLPCKEIYPEFWKFTTNYTMPISTVSSQNISITVTTESSSNFYFINSQTNLSLREYSYTFITTNTSLTLVQYTTTKVSNNASYTTLVGTSVASNNSLFSIITEENSDGFGISPIAGIVFRPDRTTFYASNLSASYEGLYTNHIVTYSQKPRSAVTFSKTPFDTATRYKMTTATTGTITNIYTYTYWEESSSQRTLTYNYDGSTGSWETTSTNYTSLGTSEDYYLLTTYSNLGDTEVYAIRTTSTVEQYATSILFQSAGSVLDGNAMVDYSISLETVNTASTSIVTSSASLDVAFSVSYTSTYTGVIGQSFNTGSGSITSIRYDNDQTLYTRKTDQNFFAKLSIGFANNIPLSTLYGAKYDNQENRIGLGNIYRTQATNYINPDAHDGFSEIPAIFGFKNRFTYNATSVIPNNGMLSNIKSKADVLNDFPANGVGRTYTEYSTDSTSFTTYTHTEKLNVQVDQIPTGYMFTLPEGSTVETSNTTRYTFRYGDGGKGFPYTRYSPTSSTTYSLQILFGFRGSTDSMRLQYRPSYFDQYNTNSSFPEVIVVPSIKSIKEIEDVLMVSGTQITNDPASLSNRDLITASNAFSYTFINKTGGTTNSTSTFSRGSYTFSKNAVLRTIDVFTPSPYANSAFPTGWAIPTQQYPSFLNFTNYFGSTYIDV